MKLIPIYTKIIKDGRNYTIFLDGKTRFTYKADHKDSGQDFLKPSYWIFIFTFIGVMRAIQGINLPFSKIGTIIGVIVLGIISGKYFYKKFGYRDVKEIYLTESMIEDYIEKGKKVFKLEVWIAAISFVIFLILIISYYFTSSLALLIFSFFAFVFFIVYLNRLPKERIRLYKD